MTFTPWCDPEAVTEAAGVSDVQGSDAALSASLLLWRLSGRRYGTADLRLRPAHLGHQGGWPGWTDIGWGLPLPGPGPYGGLRFGAGPWLASWPCPDNLHGRQINLPDLTTAVASVEEDGVTLSSGTWRYDPPARLTRLDGKSWRTGQDLTLAAGAVGTWSISLTVGRPLPADAASVAYELAVELAKAIAGKPCRLPERVTQVSRQGATFLLTDPMEIIDKGGVGLLRVDRWIGSVNPSRQSMPTQVWIPGDDPAEQFYTV
jgi:hypothetical protein